MISRSDRFKTLKTQSSGPAASARKQSDAPPTKSKNSTTKRTSTASPTSKGIGSAQLKDLCVADKTKVAKLVAQVTTLTSENDELRKRVEDMTREKDNASTVTTNEELARNLLEAVEENRALEARRKEALRLLLKYQEKMNHLVSEARLSRRLAAEANSEFSAAGEEIHRLEALVSHQRGSIEALRSGSQHLVVMEDELRSCREQLRIKTDEASRFEQKLSRVDSNSKFLAKQLDELLPELVHKNDRIRSLEQQLQLTRSPRDETMGNYEVERPNTHPTNQHPPSQVNYQQSSAVAMSPQDSRYVYSGPSHIQGPTAQPIHSQPRPAVYAQTSGFPSDGTSTASSNLRSSLPNTLPSNPHPETLSHPLRASFPRDSSGMGTGVPAVTGISAADAPQSFRTAGGDATNQSTSADKSLDEEQLRSQYNQQFMSMWGDMSIDDDGSPQRPVHPHHHHQQQQHPPPTRSIRSESVRSSHEQFAPQPHDLGAMRVDAPAVHGGDAATRGCQGVSAAVDGQLQSLRSSHSPYSHADMLRESSGDGNLPFSSSITTISAARYAESISTATTAMGHVNQQARQLGNGSAGEGLEDEWNFDLNAQQPHIVRYGHREPEGRSGGVAIRDGDIQRPSRTISPPPPPPPPSQQQQQQQQQHLQPQQLDLLSQAQHDYRQQHIHQHSAMRPAQDSPGKGAVEVRGSREPMTDSITFTSTPPRGIKTSSQHHALQPLSPPPDDLHSDHNAVHKHTIAVQTTPTLKPAYRKHTGEVSSVSWATAADDSWQNSRDCNGEASSSHRRTIKEKGKNTHNRTHPRITRPLQGPFRPAQSSAGSDNRSSSHRSSVKVSASSQQLAARSLMSGSSSLGLSKKYFSSSGRGRIDKTRDDNDMSSDDGRSTTKSVFVAGLASPGLTTWDAIRDDYDGESMPYGKELFDLVDELEDVSYLGEDGSFVFGDGLLDGI